MTTAEPRLFAVPGVEPGPEPLSADRRRTLANANLLASGVHPATRRPLAGEGTCGTCAHAGRWSNGNRAWWKCDLHRLGVSHSAASDIRVSWPACVLWEPREEAP